MTTLKQLDAKLQEQARLVDNLRAALDVQFKRIAQIQAELDVLPIARERRKSLRARLELPSNNGNGLQPSSTSDSGRHPTVRSK